MNATKLSLLKGTTILLCIMLAGPTSAESWRSKPLSGCYEVRGHFEALRATPQDLIGLYRFVFTKRGGKRFERRVFRGPIKGTPHTQTDTGAVATHVLGTEKRVGTMSSEDDVITVLNVDCVDEQGNPGIVEALEALNFVKGTGVFSGLESGSMIFEGVIDSCNDSNLTLVEFETTERGEMCFR